MKMIVDDLEDAYYMDIVISDEEIKKIKSCGMAECRVTCGGKRFYVGVRIDLSDSEEN